ncbi:TetR/AcrR family transcriptional regulator [Actinophytocola sp.]|uniref:TetR/AcrR family transcriptional regulator n=1 Tax=Actinophytocola sp. TaxID=1872138 RepID=UPI002D7FF726|nr:TetR/AcrR family transcriptional regulator [Actinophytocola sp.]HET9140086.1 TetR/AcrR family transcriptional regulator [Actinophytocola sp.]
MDLRIERGRTTRERLIAAGIDLFGRLGYEATSIGAILEATGLARGAFYHHFASKAELFDAVLDRMIGHMAEQSAEAARRFDDPVDTLRAGCSTWLDVALDPVAQRITIIEATAVVGWQRCRELDERHSLGRTRATLRRIARSGRIPAENVDMLAHMVCAAVAEAAMLIARAQDKRAARDAGQAALDILLNRLVSPEPAEAPAPSQPPAPRKPT